MDFSLTEQQEILRKFAGDFLTSQYPAKVVKELEKENGHSPEIWQEMSALGWMGLPFAEEYGGAGMSFLDLCVLLEEMGKEATISPFFADVVLGGLGISDFGAEAQKKQFLPLISSGEKIITLALFEQTAKMDASCIQTTAKQSNGKWIINGTKMFVPFAHVADYLLCIARTGSSGNAREDITVFIIDARQPGIQCNLQKTRTDKICEVILNNAEASADSILGGLNRGWPIAESIMNKSVIARCCEATGTAQKTLDMSVEYAAERKQYGRPIGSFQAMQFYCADMLTDIFGMRVSSYNAAWMLSENMECLPQIEVATSWAGQAVERIVNSAHQVHGAMGFTLDYNLHYYTRRLKNAQFYFDLNRTYNNSLASEIGI
jgi:alkylation response protein AidB-like acyl-CoA dehydrogenase